MPGPLHQAFVSVLRRRECALELAMVAFDSDGKARAGLLFEPQLRIDPGKGIAWPIYWVTLRTRHGCPVWEIVVSPDDGVVRWATNRLFRGEPQIPFVIGRDHVQPVLELARALANPAWAAVTAALHARGPHARAAAEIVVQACVSLPAEDRRCYLRLVFAGLEEDIVNAIKPNIPEELKWELTEYERQGGWFKNGLAEGREQGRVEGQRKALFAAIEARGFVLGEEQRAIIEACSDGQQLDRWLRRLFHVDSAEALLAGFV